MADMMDSIRPDHVEEAPKQQEQESDEEPSGEQKSEINPEAVRSASKSNNNLISPLFRTNMTSPPILGLQKSASMMTVPPSSLSSKPPTSTAIKQSSQIEITQPNNKLTESKSPLIAPSNSNLL